ncbi:carbohydrate-binding module family 1 protein, partial [Oidiodendron maius Zn]
MAATAVLPRVHALSSSLQQVTDFNSTPTNAKMYVYIPTSKVASPPIIVAIHHCDGTGPSYFGETQGYAQNADKYGYIVIYPSSPSSGGCWDVSSTASLTHDGGGDSQTIVNMVKYAETHYGGDINRVYMTGSSSGAMMTNVLAGAYPDIFKAGTLYGGVPDGCFYVAGATPGTTPAWNGECSSGNLIKTAQQWGDQARSYYPGYSGSRPRMLIFHGTIDTTLYYANFGEELKQWSNVLGVSFNHNETNTPIPGYTKIVYGDGTELVGISCYNVGHTPPVRVDDDLAWFGIPGSSTTTPITTSTTAPTTTTSSIVSGQATLWGQCGGIGWAGAMTCVSGSCCTYSNPYYSQC